MLAATSDWVPWYNDPKKYREVEPIREEDEVRYQRDRDRMERLAVERAAKVAGKGKPKGRAK